jgi:hypothetical protein
MPLQIYKGGHYKHNDNMINDLRTVLLGLHKPSSSESAYIVYLLCFTVRKLCHEKREYHYSFPVSYRDSLLIQV